MPTLADYPTIQGWNAIAEYDGYLYLGRVCSQMDPGASGRYALWRLPLAAAMAGATVAGEIGGQVLRVQSDVSAAEAVDLDANACAVTALAVAGGTLWAFGRRRVAGVVSVAFWSSVDGTTWVLAGALALGAEPTHRHRAALCVMDWGVIAGDADGAYVLRGSVVHPAVANAAPLAIGPQVWLGNTLTMDGDTALDDTAPFDVTQFWAGGPLVEAPWGGCAAGSYSPVMARTGDLQQSFGDTAPVVTSTTWTSKGAYTVPEGRRLGTWPQEDFRPHVGARCGKRVLLGGSGDGLSGPQVMVVTRRGVQGNLALAHYPIAACGGDRAWMIGVDDAGYYSATLDPLTGPGAGLPVLYHALSPEETSGDEVMVFSLTSEWADGTTTAEPQINSLTSEWADGSEVGGAGGAEPEVYSLRSEWAGRFTPDEGDEVLYLQLVTGGLATDVRLNTAGTPAEELALTGLVRVDSAEAVDNLGSYSPCPVRANVELETPGTTIDFALVRASGGFDGGVVATANAPVNIDPPPAL